MASANVTAIDGTGVFSHPAGQGYPLCLRDGSLCSHQRRSGVTRCRATTATTHLEQTAIWLPQHEVIEHPVEVLCREHQLFHFVEETVLWKGDEHPPRFQMKRLRAKSKRFGYRTATRTAVQGGTTEPNIQTASSSPERWCRTILT